MPIKILEEAGPKVANAGRKDLLDAIRAAGGRVIIGETITLKQPMVDGVSSVELLKSWGADMVTMNHYNVDLPMIPGLRSTQAGIEKFGSYWNEQGSKGCLPDIKQVEYHFQKLYLQYGFGRTIAEAKTLTGIPVGITLEPVAEDSDYPPARVANAKNASRAVEQGANYVIIIQTPSMPESEFAKSVAKVREGVGEKGLVKAGKMPWGSSFLNIAEQFITEDEIKRLAESGADAVILPSPGTVPGLTVEIVRNWVNIVHNCGLLAETTIGTSQEGAEADVMRRFAIDSKMTGADMFQVGDGGYSGTTLPENLMAFAMSIKGRRHTLRRMAMSPLGYDFLDK
jgi:methylmalonyl-CoA mutase cobalamin-binding subunit